MSVESSGHDEHYIRVLRRRFRAWRGGRPFWAGLLTMLGGVPIGWLPYAEIKIGHLTMAMATTAGAGSLIIGVLLVTLGLTMWFHHIVRVFAGVASILLALVSIPVSNLGGFFVGFSLALVGGALSVSWVPAKTGETAEPADSDETPDTPFPGNEPHPGHEPDGAPGNRSDGAPFMSDTSVDANGGRNSAG
ncbi:DUF6114 domain-containing protein [Streptomyces sp. H27-C3]|uniref:DUF6114 domain-containing protein n=1 Tax=Streptomyces sp. H27-C3 TaxID=3046305 RepID=UPI0024B8E2E7|nr:DUF6114 domain-containing protein [Streptomyces sp. H27-C3]MDJ0460717.1 DUF6114 domain-containing protein [Streptomyces sp. H27-C3]